MKKTSGNLLSLFISDGITRIIGLAATVYIARMLAVEGFGLINYGLAFISYALLFANPGLTIIGTREVAKDPHDRRFIEETLGLRLVLAILMFTFFFVGTIVIPGDITTKGVILVYAFTLFPFALLLEFVFQGREEMAYIGAGRIIQYGIYLVVLLLFLKQVTDILIVPLAFVVSYLINAVFLIAIFISKYRSFRFRFSISKWRMILSSSVPVGLAVIFNHVTISLPPIVLGIFRSNYAVGIFSAGYKIIFVLLIIERVFYYVFFPLLSRQHKRKPERLTGSFNFLMRFLFAFAIPVGLGGLLLAPGMIDLVYGQAFMDAVNVLRILLIYFMIVPVNTILGYGLIAIDQERRFFQVIAITAMINAALIIVLGLQFGFYGAAIALLVSEAIGIMLMHRQLKKFVRFDCLKYIPRPLSAALLMVLFLYILPEWNVIILAFLGGGAYLLVFYFLKGFTKDDLNNFRRAIIEK